MKIFIPAILGLIVGLITNNIIDYDLLIKPDFYPPTYIFSIVWPILYLLMGISGFIISKTDNETAKKLFRLQLLLNLMWPFIFSVNYLLSFVLIILLIVVVIQMLIEFYKESKLAFYLQIPYLLWLIFAAILNYSIYKLNMI